MPKITIAIVGLLTIALVTSIVLFLVKISHPRVIAKVVTPDLTELCIVQQCNWDAEPFTTSFVYHKPGQQWRWFYYDHQDLYWGSASVAVNTNTHTAVFYRGSLPAVTFNWESEMYTLHRWNRTLTNFQAVMRKEWAPNMSVYNNQQFSK